MTIVFDGKKFAEEKEEKLMRALGDLRNLGKIPKLVAILVGDNRESELYLKLKEKTAKRLGIDFEMKKFSGENPQEIIDFIEEKNRDAGVNGIMVELPLPKQLVISNKPACAEASAGRQLGILDTIDPKKDVDCLTSSNLELLEKGHPKFIPPTAKAVGEILKYQISNIKYQKHRQKTKDRKKKVVVVGGGGAVGKSILSYLRCLGKLSVRGIDKETQDLGAVTKEADILISATGVGHLIKKSMVKPGAAVIDVGIEKQPDGKLIGDVDFENVKKAASFITPVPGGVGPVTIICLMENLLQNLYH